jgi:hypothetical protein
MSLLVSCVVLGCGIAIGEVAGASAPPPTLTVSPSSGLFDGETVSVSVPANGYFTPGSRVNILECADPGGTSAHLPKDDSTCDGSTIQGPTVLVAANGSFSEPAYTVYELPSPALGEQHNSQPVCSATNLCVLYVGQNQNDFTAPKVFSTPFGVGPGTTTGSTSETSGGTSTSTTTASGNKSATGSSTTLPASSSNGGTDPSVSLSSAGSGGTLARTGAPTDLIWMAALGAILILGGSYGRRLSQRRAE